MLIRKKSAVWLGYLIKNFINGSLNGLPICGEKQIKALTMVNIAMNIKNNLHTTGITMKTVIPKYGNIKGQSRNLLWKVTNKHTHL